MKNLMNRMWRCNPVFSFLFLLSFSMVILLMLYGMTFFGRILIYQSNMVKASYQNEIQMLLKTDASIKLEADSWPEVSEGNLFFCATLPIMNDWSEVANQVWVLVNQNEPLKEIVDYGKIPSMDEELQEPSVLVGKAYESYIFLEDGKKYIYLQRLKCRVCAILSPECSIGNDTRVILYWSGLNEAEKQYVMEACVNMQSANMINVEIFSDDEISEESIEQLTRYIQQYDIGYGMQCYTANMGCVMSYEMQLGRSKIMFLYVFGIIALFGIACVVAIVICWTQMKQREHLILFINGYSFGKLYLKIAFELLCYEAMALFVSFPCWILWTNMRQIEEMWMILCYGAIPMILALISLPLLLSFVALLFMFYATPRTYLQAE